MKNKKILILSMGLDFDDIVQKYIDGKNIINKGSYYISISNESIEFPNLEYKDFYEKKRLKLQKNVLTYLKNKVYKIYSNKLDNNTIAIAAETWALYFTSTIIFIERVFDVLAKNNNNYQILIPKIKNKYFPIESMDHFFQIIEHDLLRLIMLPDLLNIYKPKFRFEFFDYKIKKVISPYSGMKENCESNILHFVRFIKNNKTYFIFGNMGLPLKFPYLEMFLRIFNFFGFINISGINKNIKFENRKNIYINSRFNSDHYYDEKSPFKNDYQVLINKYIPHTFQTFGLFQEEIFRKVKKNSFVLYTYLGLDNDVDRFTTSFFNFLGIRIFHIQHGANFQSSLVFEKDTIDELSATKFLTAGCLHKRENNYHLGFYKTFGTKYLRSKIDNLFFSKNWISKRSIKFILIIDGKSNNHHEWDTYNKFMVDCKYASNTCFKLSKEIKEVKIKPHPSYLHSTLRYISKELIIKEALGVNNKKIPYFRNKGFIPIYMYESTALLEDIALRSPFIMLIKKNDYKFFNKDVLEVLLPLKRIGILHDSYESVLTKFKKMNFNEACRFLFKQQNKIEFINYRNKLSTTPKFKKIFKFIFSELIFN